MKKALKYIIFLGLVIFMDMAIYEPYALKITSYNLENPLLSNLKIVFASDFHIAPYKWEKWRLSKIVDKINAENPDLVILGGDYTNRHNKKASLSPKDIAKTLQKIKAPKVAVLGNHDSYFSKKDVMNALQQANIPVLDNTHTELKLQNKTVFIAGVSDYDTDKPDINKTINQTKKPLIFVTHSPDVFQQLNGRADIAFAGHTHGGQIILPFLGALITNIKSGRKYTYGLLYEQQKPLIVSSGLGTSIIPIRFNNLPEIVSVKFK